MKILLNYFKEMSFIGAFLIASQPVSTQNYAMGLYFEEWDGQATIIRGDEEYKGHIVVPEVITWYDGEVTEETTPEELESMKRESTVVDISVDAFADCKGLLSIKLPNTLKDGSHFGNYHGCTSLQKIELPETLTKLISDSWWDGPDWVYYGPFESCTSLKSINLPKDVRLIGRKAFYGCTNLTVDFPKNIVEVEDSAFVGCTFSSTEITIPYHNVEEDGLPTSIGLGAFAGTNLETLKYNGQYLSDHLGGGESLKKLVIGPQVEYVSLRSGVTDGLESIVVDAANPTLDSRENCNAVIRTATNELLAGCGVSTIPASVEIIGQYAFEGCMNLKHIDLPSTLRDIRYNAFARCGLEEITIPVMNFTDGDECIFLECHQLKSVTLSEGLTIVPFSMFEKCDALESITFPSTMKDIGKMAFYGCTALQSVKSLAKDAPKMRDNTFSKVTYENCPLYIREDAQNYHSGYWWYKFKNVQKFSFDAVSAINSGQNTEFSAYDINGRKLSKMQRGVNVLLMSDGTRRKVVVK
jgi:hypothetical protein